MPWTQRWSYVYRAGFIGDEPEPTDAALLGAGLARAAAWARDRLTVLVLFGLTATAAPDCLAGPPQQHHPSSSAAVAHAPAATHPLVDHYGDPLPPGAVARLGTVRFRHSGWVEDVACSPDGRRLASNDGMTVVVWDVATGKEVRRFHGHRGWVRCVAYSPDGTTIASAGDDKVIFVWDVRTGRKLLGLRGHGSGPRLGRQGVAQLLFLPDGKRLLSRGEDNTIRLWDLTSGQEVRQFTGHEDPLWTIALARDGKTLAAFAKEPVTDHNKPGEVRVWDVATGKERRRWLLPDDVCLDTFSPDLGILVTRPRSGPEPLRLKLWDVATGTVRRTLPVDALTVGFTADGKTLIVPHDGSLGLWDVGTGKEVRRFRDPDRNADGHLACLPDGRTLALWRWGSGGNTVRLCDLATGQAVHHFDGHEAGVAALAFSPDGKRLASGEGEEVRVWNVATRSQVRLIHGDLNFITALAFGPDGKTLFAGTANRGVRTWDVSAGREMRVIVHTSPVLDMALSPDGSNLVTWDGNCGGPLRSWETASGKPRWEQPSRAQRPLGPRWSMSSVTFSPDGRVLAVGGSDRCILLWDAATGRELSALGTTGHCVTAVAFSPDGRLVAGQEWDGPIRLWERATGQCRAVVDAGPGVRAVAFAPEGRLLAVAHHRGDVPVGDDRAGRRYRDTVELVDVASGKVVQSFAGHRGGVKAIAFAPDGKVLASAGEDTTVLLWDAAGARCSARPGPRPLRPAELEALWSDLGGTDAGRAHRAVWALVAAAGQSLSFLRERARPTAPLAPGQLAQLVRDLDENRFAVRERATRRLEELGERIRGPLQQAQKDAASPEVRRRIQRVLDRMDHGFWSPDDLRLLRSIEVLERIDTQASRRILQALGRASPHGRLAREATAALERLGRAGRAQR